MSSSSLPPEIALRVAQLERQYDLLDQQARLESAENAIRDTCDDLELDALVELVETKELYRPRHRSDRAWIRSLDPSICDAIELSRGRQRLCKDLASKINQSWNVWPWQLVGQQYQPRCWSKEILEPLYKLSCKGCDRSKAEALLAQARIDRAGRNYSDPAMGARRDDIFTEVDVTTALKSYQQLTVEPASKKRKEPGTDRSTRIKTRRTTYVQAPSGNNTSSPKIDIGVGQNHQRPLANDELNNGSPMALLSSGSRSSYPFQGSLSLRTTLSPDPLGHDEERFLSKAGHGDTAPPSSAPKAKYTVGGDGNSEHGSVYQDGDADDKVPMSEEKDSVSGHTHHTTVPSNDLSGAVGTLGDGQWVSSTAIELTLNKLRWADIRIFDPSFFAGAPTYGLKWIGDEKLWVMPLLLLGDHWALITIEIDACTVSFWDSLEDKAHESEARRIVDAFEQFVRTSRTITYQSASEEFALRDRRWVFDVQKCPQQATRDDCGIYTIVFAIYKSVGLTLPESLDVGLWRQLFKHLLQADSAVLDVSGNQTAGIVSTFDSPTNNAALAPKRKTAQQVPFPEGPKFPQGELDCFKSHDKRLSSALGDARRHARLSADTQQCLTQIQEQVAAFHEQNVQQEREMSEAIQVHREMISTYSRLGASRSQDLNVLLDTQLESCEARHQDKQNKVAKLTAAVESWEMAAQRCNTVHNYRSRRVDSRRKILQDFSKELKSWSKTQRTLLRDVEALEGDIAANVGLQY